MKIPVLYTCAPDKAKTKTAEMLECHTAQQLLEPQNVSWTAELKVLKNKKDDGTEEDDDGNKLTITFHLSGQDVSEEETLEEVIDPEDIISTKGKKTLVKKLKRLLEIEEDLSEHMDLIEQIFDGTIHLDMVEMKELNGNAVIRFEVDIDVVPDFCPSFDITC